MTCSTESMGTRPAGFELQPSDSLNSRRSSSILVFCEHQVCATPGCHRQRQYPIGCDWDRCCKDGFLSGCTEHDSVCNAVQAQAESEYTAVSMDGLDDPRTSSSIGSPEECQICGSVPYMLYFDHQVCATLGWNRQRQYEFGCNWEEELTSLQDVCALAHVDLEIAKNEVRLRVKQSGFAVYDGAGIIFGCLAGEAIEENSSVPLISDMLVTSHGYCYCAETCIVWQSGQAAYAHTQSDAKLQVLLEYCHNLGVAGVVREIHHRRQSNSHKDEIEEKHLGNNCSAFRDNIKAHLQKYGMLDDRTEINVKKPRRDPNHGAGDYSVAIRGGRAQIAPPIRRGE